MAEITEVFEDFGENTKKLFKNKKFLLAAGGVAVVALIAGYLKNREGEADTTGYGAIGYAGYPTVGGSSSSDFSSSTETDSYFESLLNETTTEYDGVMAEMESNISSLTDRLVSSEEKSASYLLTIEKQNAISQMRANSELYNALGSGDAATKQALHDENMAIAEKYGWTFDASTGNYFDGNTVLYTTAKQAKGENTAYTGGKKAADADVSGFQNNRDYQAEINKAILSGADAVTINRLNDQRNAKIAAQGGLTGAQSSGFDKNVDYSVAIQKAKEAGANEQVIKNLEQQRQNKINAVYGGKDPAKK